MHGPRILTTRDALWCWPLRPLLPPCVDVMMPERHAPHGMVGSAYTSDEVLDDLATWTCRESVSLLSLLSCWRTPTSQEQGGAAREQRSYPFTPVGAHGRWTDMQRPISDQRRGKTLQPSLKLDLVYSFMVNITPVLLVETSGCSSIQSQRTW